jgi:hypothetical integral membrane protein (TIGR02206 family)
VAGYREFSILGVQHLTVLALLCLVGLGLVRLRNWAERRREVVGKVIGLALLGYAAAIYGQKAVAGELSWDSSLPLEFCHWVLAACVFSLFRRSQTGTELAYYWGLAGTLQATLTPDINHGFPSWEFVQFFWSHGGILLALVFLCFARNFSPRPDAVLRMFVGVNVYALAVGSTDALFGWNYGYLCEKPVNPSLLDYLGPWPWYLIVLEGIALASFVVLDLPWRLRRRVAGNAPKIKR